MGVAAQRPPNRNEASTLALACQTREERRQNTLSALWLFQRETAHTKHRPDRTVGQAAVHLD
jgi:hypothetical protein